MTFAGSVSRRDLDQMLDATADLHRELDGCRLLITGGTGFFGRWLLESWADSSDRLGLERRAVVITRDPAGFTARAPELAAHRTIELIRGDVLDDSPVPGTVDACIHAATAASLELTQRHPRLMFDTIVTGTANVLRWTALSAETPFLFTSSGAVYGSQDPAVTGVDESSKTGPDPLDPNRVYGEAKRAAEMLCALEAAQGRTVVVARCFAFVGPHLPIDTHFAIGNFIRDALADGPVVVGGDGTTVRSYMYPTDLVTWLWTMLLRGAAGRAYNVGSPDGHDLASIARLVAAQAGGLDVVIRGTPQPGRAIDRYVPDITRARTELGLDVRVGLADAVDRSMAWHRGRR
jgi:dTDP-glucose 4,6-dehydratase